MISKSIKDSDAYSKIPVRYQTLSRSSLSGNRASTTEFGLRKPLYVTLDRGPGGLLHAQKRAAWSLAGCLAVIVCVCLGALYEFSQGPMCWSCGSSDSSESTGRTFFGFSASARVRHCRGCGKVWRVGFPWRATPGLPLRPDPRSQFSLPQNIVEPVVVA
jgi:hypothetical protein